MMQVQLLTIDRVVTCKGEMDDASASKDRIMMSMIYQSKSLLGSHYSEDPSPHWW